MSWITTAPIAFAIVLGNGAVGAEETTRTVETSRLQLPSYALPGADPLTDDVPQVPTLTERVEVIGKPMDTEWLTAKMAWWLADFDLVYGSAPPMPGGAPTLHDMYEHRPHGPTAVNLTPLLFWAAEKLGEK